MAVVRSHLNERVGGPLLPAVVRIHQLPFNKEMEMSKNPRYKQGLTDGDEDAVREMSNNLLAVITDHDGKYTPQVCALVKVHERLGQLLNNLLVRELE